ncbi:PAS domain-containing sensor histidine kinase [Desulfobacula toluolica]|uniref:histidine kinase n=1 Tax=Desulfobacula toluolica (strain DSM 7467 / Tol2) TaxID=651182 RepID=K0NIC9_DESTT|nr:PAS domain-containing sensor histidine kinase [Desulfobacula toluolica]CCK81141.1 two component system sensor histidine kinase [Desulfobacula toluolica Tol2]
MKFGIRKKFLTGFLMLSLLPLIALSFYIRAHIDSVFNTLLERNRTALTKNSMSLLEARAQAIAAQVEQLLSACVDDLRMLATLPADPSIYLDFEGIHQRKIWYLSRTGREMREEKPLYREVTFIDAQGVVEIQVENRRLASPGQKVSTVFNTDFGLEDYFSLGLALKDNEIYVSRLTGYHISRNEQLNGAANVEEASGGRTYEGIIRFAAKKMDKGICQGVVSLALDHRHLMEFTQHVLPFGNGEVLFPNYESGNYAFMFDDEGWIITHPKLWDIRGFDAKGNLIDPTSDAYGEENLTKGRFPFNLLHVPFVHENYHHIAQQVIAGNSGVKETASVKGVSRVLAYAPVIFNHGVYEKNGCFGGVTLGAQTDEFHRSVAQTSAEIDFMIKRLSGKAILLILFIGVLVAAIALFLAKNFTTPIVRLTEKVNEISSGNYDVNIEIKSRDELEILGGQFTKMGSRLKQHEQNLVRSLDELRQHVDLLKSIHAGMLSSLVVFNRNGKILSANPRAFDFFNLSQEEMLKSDIQTLLAPYPELMALTQKNLKDKEIHGESLEVKLPGGKQMYLETSISNIRGEMEKSDPSTLLIFRDVTRRKKMERHIRRSDKLVSLGILAAGIAHEIRNPLTGITLMLDDLHDRIANRTNDRLLIQQALEEIEKLENIVIRLLEFASRPGHAPVLEDINRVVADTLFFVKKQCKQKGVTLRSKTTPGLPRIPIDRERIQQALLNIVLNALNALEKSREKDSGREDEILISTCLVNTSEEKIVVLSIRDNGPGIAEEDMDAIFDPFFSHNADGFGLGLSITHTIMEEHGGTITVENKPGGGACFQLHLPVVQ